MKKGMKKFIAFSVSTAMAMSGLVFMQAGSAVDAGAASEYQLVWSDEFNGTTLNTNNWNIEVNGNGGGNNELQYYTDNSKNVKVKDGCLQLTAVKENYNNKEYTSGRINSNNKQSFKYGKIEAKLRIPSFSGAWPAFWMLGANFNSVGWPKCGEIDIMEHINTGNSIVSNLHWSYNNTQADTQNASWYNTGDITDWHVYGFEWDENQMKFYCDDNVYQTYTISTQSQMEEFRAKQFIIFNLAVGGQWPGYNIDNTVFTDGDDTNNTLFVDWVRVYQTQDQIDDVTTTSAPYTGKYVDITEDELAYSDSKWGTYVGTDWAGAAASDTKGATLKDGITMNISSVGNDLWGIQAFVKNLSFYKGQTYTYKCTITSDVTKKIRVKVVGNSDEYILSQDDITVQAGQPYYYSKDLVVKGDYADVMNIYFGLGWTDGDTIAQNSKAVINITNLSMTVNGSVREDESKRHQEIKDRVNPNNETTTATVSETTSKQDASTKYENATDNSTVNDGVKKAQVKILKISPKKKNSKKIKITLAKKINNATGYQVRVYKSKKLAKKNSGALVKYTSKENSKKITVKSSKLKNKTKLYVRVRAYAKVKGNKIYSNKWSAVKRVKVK